MEFKGNVLITGTSTGIGKATALHLDQLGFRVFAGIRKASDGDALHALASERLTPICLDVADARSILAARTQISESIGGVGLTGLVNNAGTGFSMPLEFAPLDSVRELFEVNVFGLLAVTQAFLPLVRQGRGRIINVSSSSSIVVAPFHGPYSASKVCVNALSDALRLELKPLGVQVSAVLPGSIDTPIWQKAAEGSDRLWSSQPAEIDEVYGQAWRKFRDYVQGMAQRGISPESVARVIAQALMTNRARPYYIVGKDTRNLKFLKSIVPERFHDRLILRTLGIES